MTMEESSKNGYKTWWEKDQLLVTSNCRSVGWSDDLSASVYSEYFFDDRNCDIIHSTLTADHFVDNY